MNICDDNSGCCCETGLNNEVIEYISFCVDETPSNCEKFMDGDGMELFIQCLKVGSTTTIPLNLFKKTIPCFYLISLKFILVTFTIENWFNVY